MFWVLGFVEEPPIILKKSVCSHSWKMDGWLIYQIINNYFFLLGQWNENDAMERNLQDNYLTLYGMSSIYNSNYNKIVLVVKVLWYFSNLLILVKYNKVNVLYSLTNNRENLENWEKSGKIILKKIWKSNFKKFGKVISKNNLEM